MHLSRSCCGGMAVLAVALTGSASADTGATPLLWTVSDDDLSLPIGTIADAAVGSDGAVYLLDTQNWTVLRIAADGSELPPLGRRGEGPGEFMHPRALAPHSGGGCTVVQDFYSPAVCLLATGKVCSAPDVSLIRNRFAITQFLGVRADNRDRLILTTLTADRIPESSSPEGGPMPALSLVRIGREDSRPQVLFSDRSELCEHSTVRLKRYADSYADRCWDVNNAGRIIFADPDGGYRVTVGHPADGASRSIDLPVAGTDEQALKHLAKATNRSAKDIPAIAALYWIGDEHFLVKPMAGIEHRTNSQGGVFESFDLEGKSHGRSALRCRYNPDQDEFFLRNGMLVIIEGGKSVNDATIRRQAAMIGKTIAPPASGNPPDVIRVHAYDLVAHYTGVVRFSDASIRKN